MYRAAQTMPGLVCLVLSLMTCAGCTNHASCRYEKLYRDLLTKHYSNSNLAGGRKYRPDPHAEKYVELMLGNLRQVPEEENDEKTLEAWREAVDFFVMRTSVPWEIFPRARRGVFVDGHWVMVERRPEREVMRTHRAKMANGIAEWLDARRGRLVYSTFARDGLGAVVPRDDAPVDVLFKGFCSLEEQTVLRPFRGTHQGTSAASGQDEKKTK